VYKEQRATATTWRYPRQFVLQLPLDLPATFVVNEEDAFKVGDNVTTSPVPSTLVAQFDPSKMVDLVDPKTLAPTGKQVLLSDVYVALFSFYLSLARERDTMPKAPLMTPPMTETIPGPVMAAKK